MYHVCMLAVGYTYSVMFYQVEAFGKCPYFMGDSACFSADVLTLFSICFGRGELDCMWAHEFRGGIQVGSCQQLLDWSIQS